MLKALSSGRAWFSFGLVLALTAPFWLALVPGFGFNNYTYSVLNLALVYSLVALGLNLLTGYAGQISLGHSGLMAIGAYATASLTTQFSLPVGLSLVVAALVTGLVGIGLALPALRLSGPYLAVATIGFAVAVPQLLRLVNFRTEGVEGLKLAKPNLPGFGPDDDLARYYLFLPGIALAYLLAANLVKSKIGRAWQGLRESEIAAQATGISLVRAKIEVFAVSGVLTGLAGGLYICQIGRVNADEFNLLLSIYFLAMIAVGGLGRLAGAAAGAILLTILPELVNRLSSLAQDLLNGAGVALQLKNPQYILYGLLLMLVVLFLPEGLAGAFTRLTERLRPAPEAVLSSVQPSGLASLDLGSTPALTGQLELKDLTVRFGGLVAVSEVSLSVPPGQIVGLIGPNGAGKTTLFNCLSRLEEPEQGLITWEGRSLLALPPSALARLGLARLFQNGELFKKLSVRENLLLGQHCRLRQSFLDGLLGTRRQRAEEEQANLRAEAMLTFLALPLSLADLPAHGLAFGQARLVELGRALLSGPRLLLLDEPAAGTHGREKAELVTLLRTLRDRLGLTILLVEHDMAVVMEVCDRLYVMDFGRLIATGTPDEIRRDPLVIEAYLG